MKRSDSETEIITAMVGWGEVMRRAKSLADRTRHPVSVFKSVSEYGLTNFWTLRSHGTDYERPLGVFVEKYEPTEGRAS